MRTESLVRPEVEVPLDLSCSSKFRSNSDKSSHSEDSYNYTGVFATFHPHFGFGCQYNLDVKADSKCSGSDSDELDTALSRNNFFNHKKRLITRYRKLF